MTEFSNKSVLIGLSGGVDSAVSAYLLKKQGYDVHAVIYILSTCQKVSLEDAKDIAKRLDIPLYIEDKISEFSDTVISYFTESYLKGETPNPCVLCNNSFKFKNLIEKADSLGIDLVATGHYANISFDNQTQRYLLKSSLNVKKDQSYFLYRLSQNQLKRILLPIADLQKEKVRKVAEEIGLTVKDKKDSQDICFIKDTDYAAFIMERSKGSFDDCIFTDKRGKVIGRGSNHVFYTPGQRRGVGKGFNKRVYVIRKDAKTNTVVLGEQEDLYSKELIVKDTNMISVDTLAKPTNVSVKIRNSMSGVSATIFAEQEHIKVIFDEPVRAAVKGQSAVFYDNDKVVGGGIIYDSL